jgi:hypothetical protein
VATHLRRLAFLCAALPLTVAAHPLAAQERAAPADGLIISWRSPPVPSMPAVIWTIAGRRTGFGGAHRGARCSSA